MSKVHPALRVRIPFILAGVFSFLFSVWLYFVKDDTSAGIFVGIWVPSIFSFATLLLGPVADPARARAVEVDR